MLVVADTSALIALSCCDSLQVLDQLCTVRAPKAVADELGSDRPESVPLAEFLIGKVVEVDLRRFVIAAGGLGRGELEAMALYRLESADLLLVDDRRARRVAAANGISTVGSLGILLLAKRAGLIPKVRPFVQRLQQSQVFLSEEVLAEVLRLADEQ